MISDRLIEDRGDEDVEEEEEFHEVEDEKLKSQESEVGPASKSSKGVDWTDIMLSTNNPSTSSPSASTPDDSDKPVAPTTTTNDSQSKEDPVAQIEQLHGAADQDQVLEKTEEKSDDQHELLVKDSEKPHTLTLPEDQNELVKDELKFENQSESSKVKPDLKKDDDIKEEQVENLKLNENSNEMIDQQQTDKQIEVQSKTEDDQKVVNDEANSPVDQKENDSTTEPENKNDDDAKPDDQKNEDVKELDLDEDVKNPQYIPKKGVFYEHDDRSQESDNKKPSTTVKKDDETVTEPTNNNKKPIKQDTQNENKRGGRRQRGENDRWNHDLFRDEKQKPKSKNELIHAYGYDIRQERSSRNQNENRPQRGSNNNSIQYNSNNNNNSNNITSDRQQDNQRSRQGRDNRTSRQGQPLNRSRDRRTRRPNNNNNNNNNNSNQTNRNRNDIPGNQQARRDVATNRSTKPESKDNRQESTDGKQSFQNSQPTPSTTRRENQEGGVSMMRDRYNRNENRNRRQNSKDRPTTNSVEEKLPPINTVMPPITTWSNKIEDMEKEEASRKESSLSKQQQPQPPPQQQQQQQNNINSNVAKTRSNDYWPQNQPNKTIYHDRPNNRNMDDRQHQHYNSRRPYQERDDSHKPTQFVNRNQYGDRPNQHHQEWRRTNHYNSYAKPNEYEPIKTQTFENSRLNQNSINRSNFRDAREIINERRMQTQQNYQTSKVQTGHLNNEQQQRQVQQQQQQLVQQHHQQFVHQQHQHLMQHQSAQQLRHHHQQQQHTQPAQQQPVQNQSPQQQSQIQTSSQTSQQQQITSAQVQNSRQQPQPQQQQPQQPQTSQAQQQQQPRQALVMNNLAGGDTPQESGRLNSAANSTSNTSDLLNSRPIIKTDAYNGSNVAPQHAQPQQQQQQPLQQHSHNHRTLGGPMSQQGPSSAGSHLLPSHLGAAGAQAQYYTPTGNSRDSAAAAAALATAYHGYLPSGHSVMDTTRYHMTSQQMSEHGYMAPAGQPNAVDVAAAASVMHQQGMYSEAGSAGGTVASSAYLAQAGSTLSPSNNIPVTGAGPPPLAPVLYSQHSQYAPPPYSNPYSQPQHNQAPPPQSSHPYPYWTYI